MAGNLILPHCVATTVSRMARLNMEFRRALVWHSVTRGMRIKLEPSARVFKKPTRENLINVVPATPQIQASTLYNEGKCTTLDELRSYTYAPTAWWQ